MNLPSDVLMLVGACCDIDTLCKVSQTPMWNDFLPAVSTQHSWFLRLSLILLFELEEDSSCWKTTYHVYSLASTPIMTPLGLMPGIYSLNVITLQAVKIFARLGYDLDIANNRALNLACKQNDVELVAFLLQESS